MSHSFLLKVIIPILSIFITLTYIITLCINFGAAYQFNAPSTVCGHIVADYGEIDTCKIISWQKYWGSLIRPELGYPGPLIYYSILLIILGIADSYTSYYLPALLPGIFTIYLIVRIVLSPINKESSSFVLILGTLYFMYLSLLLTSHIYNGRPHMGLIIHFFIIYSFLRLITQKVFNIHWYIILVILMINLIYVHYTNLVITVLAVLTIIVLTKKLRAYNNRLYLTSMSLLVIMIIGILYNEYIHHNVLPLMNNFIQNLMNLPNYAFTRKVQTYYYTPQKLYGEKLLLLILKRVNQLLKLLSILVIFIVSFKFLLKDIKGNSMQSISVLNYIIEIIALIGFLCGIYEKIVYNIAEPYIGFRYEIIYGLLVVVSIVTNLNGVHSRIIKIPKLLFILLMILAITATSIDNMYVWDYKEKYYAWGLAEFVLYGNNGTLRIFTDHIMACELEYVFVHFRLLNVLDPIPYMEFGKYLVKLKTNKITNILNKRNADGIFLYISKVPLYLTGASWGSRIMLQHKHVRCLANMYNIPFNSGNGILLTIR